MTNPRRHTVGAVAACLAALLLLTACSKSTPAPQTTSAVQTTAAATDATSAATATSVAPADPASTDATPAAAPAGGGTACTLVTEADATTVLGTDPGPGSADTSNGSSQCQYGDFQSAFVLVNLNPSQGKAFYDHAFNNPKVSQAGAVTDVAGVGDRAFGTVGHGAASIYFNKGDALVIVMVEIHTASSPPNAQALALAKTAASRI